MLNIDRFKLINAVMNTDCEAEFEEVKTIIIQRLKNKIDEISAHTPFASRLDPDDVFITIFLILKGKFIAIEDRAGYENYSALISNAINSALILHLDALEQDAEDEELLVSLEAMSDNTSSTGTSEREVEQIVMNEEFILQLFNTEYIERLRKRCINLSAPNRDFLLEISKTIKNTHSRFKRLTQQQSDEVIEIFFEALLEESDSDLIRRFNQALKSNLGLNVLPQNYAVEFKRMLRTVFRLLEMTTERYVMGIESILVSEVTPTDEG